MSGYFALKLKISSCTVSSLPQPPMGYVHSLMFAPAAVLAAAEAAVEEAAVLLEELPPHAASAPAALRAPTAFRKERREILFFIRNFSLLIDVVRFYSAALVWEPLLLALL